MVRTGLMTVALLWTGSAYAAGGAFAVDDSDIGKPGDCKVESFFVTGPGGDFIASAAPACVANVIVPAELGLQFSRSRFDHEYGTSLTAKAKINIRPSEVGKVGIGFSGGTSFDLVAHENSGSFVNVPVTFALTEQFKINVNGGWTYDRVADLNWATWGAGFEWNFVKPLTLIGEVFGQAGHEIAGASKVNEPRFQLGLRYTPRESIDFDVIYGNNITGEGGDWGTAGVNVRF